MKKEALFCDGTEAYVSPPEPEAGDELQLWFRTAAHDVDEVYLENRELCIPMNKVISNKAFDFYEVKYKLEDKPFRYHFKIRSGNEICYYNKWGAESKLVDYYDFKIVPGFTAPDWAKGAVMYQIYTDRFCNGDPDNDVQTGEYFYIGEQVQHVDDWYRDPQPMDVREFYGGDIQGIIDKLDYLHGLGVEVVYCNPLFVSPSNHKYDTQDYDYIDPHVGKIEVDEGRLLDPGENNNIHADRYRTRTTRKENLEASNRLFIKLVEELHKRGMRIIIDGVFNHCGSFNKWLDRELIYESADGYEVGAFVSPKSPYRNYFLFHRTGENEWPGNGSYDGWWGHDTLPKLNYEDSKELEEYVLGIAKKWVSPPYNVDGWRLDVAADLGRSNEYNHEFWKKFRKAVKDDFDNIKSLYWELIDQEQGDPSFPHWKKGIHPSDEMLHNSIGKEELYVLEDGGEIAACAIVNDEKVDGYADVPWQIDSDEVMVVHVLAVHPEQRGKGLARNLMEHIVGSERKAGKKALRLDVIENNTAAEGLYQKLDFRYIQTKTLFYKVVGEMTFKMYELVL